MTIQKSKNFHINKKTIEYEDGECWDFIGFRNYISYNTIIAQGKNLVKTIKIEDDWTNISDNTVIEQNDNQTVLQDKCYTTYYSRYDDDNLELDCIQYITIKHNKPLEEIKKDYAKENNLFQLLKNLLSQKGYRESTYDCYNCDECYHCISKKKMNTEYQTFIMEIEFNDDQTIGEVKTTIDKDYNEIKELSKQFFKAETSMCLDFTKQGAIGEIELKHYYK